MGVKIVLIGTVIYLLFILLKDLHTKPPLTIIGNPPSDEYRVWLKKFYRKLPNGRVKWDGIVTFLDREGWGQSQALIKKNLLRRYTGVRISDVLVSTSLSTHDAILTTEKETLAHVVAFEWVLDHQNYIRLTDPEVTSFVDGMGYAFLAEKLSNLIYYLIPWDGTSIPTCDHLVVLRRLDWDGFINGPGVENLVIRQKRS